MSFMSEAIWEGYANTSSSETLKEQFSEFCNWCWGHSYGDCGAWIKWLGKNELRVFEHLAKQKHVDDTDSRQDDIAKIIYNILDHMYCDNCRFNSEIKESDSDEWNCDECHRKYNGWGVSMQESKRIAKEILNRLGE